MASGDRSETAKNEGCVHRSGPTVVRFPEEIVEQFVDLIILQGNERAVAPGNDHGRPKVEVGSPLVHRRQSIGAPAEPGEAGLQGERIDR